MVKANAQPLTKTPAIGIHLAYFDFTGADSLGSFGKNMKPGLAIHYQNTLSKRFDYSITMASSFLDFINRKNKSLGSGEKQLLLEADYSVRFNLVKQPALFKPYVQGGVGVSAYNNYYGVFIPAGAGCQVNITKDVFLLLNTQYRIPVTSTQHQHFYHSIGLAGTINRKKISKEKPALPLPIKVIQQPIDSDGDGIVDSMDKCPVVAGVIRYQGCPVPDRDGDRINDEEDQCPDVKGVPEYKGCPIPDRVENEIVVPLDVTARVNLAAKNIFFETGSFQLLSKSYPALDEVVRILREHATLQLLIEGHTDNTGTPDKNKLLSEHRAQAVMNYLIRSGIVARRLATMGYGQDKPIATNANAEGRATNRRVELKLQISAGE